MYIQQIYTNCLAHAAYYIESNGEVLIIDPLRDPQPYLELASARRAKIKYVFETHFHADFVSGHQDLARLSGAVILFGPNATPSYDALIAMDGQQFQLGEISFKVVHTPGHTIESSCILLQTKEGIPYAVFTGDTLFVGDVGRPDLLSGNLSKEVLAAMLYKSLNEKIKTLPDEVIVYPGHGAGSACGKSIGKETVSTIGEQKKNNYALQNISEEEFVQVVTSGIPNPPSYFFKDAGINKMGTQSLEMVMKHANKSLGIDDFKKERLRGALVLDTRNASDFAEGFIKGAINIGLNGDYATWVGTLVDFDKPLLLYTEKGKEVESINRLARIGYDNIVGYAEFNVLDWKNSGETIDKVEMISAKQVEQDLGQKRYELVDVRRPGERDACLLHNSDFIPLSELKSKINLLEKNKSYAICCAGGYRSMIAVSLLKASGFTSVVNVDGGVNKLKELNSKLIEEAVVL